ncbi:MAG: GDSL family lipase [Nitrospirae bacterium]|nr:GDSL family lipase [Nitrospirota bacterium]
MRIPGNIVFIGDSLTEYFDWQKRFPDYNVMNLGIAGETVEGLASRLNRIITSIDNPDLVFIMTGTNNIAMEEYDIAETYRDIVKNLSSEFKNAVIVIQSILPVSLPWIDNRAIEKINQALEKIAKELKTEYLDIYSLFIDSGKNWAKAVEDFINYFSIRISSSLSSSSSE